MLRPIRKTYHFFSKPLRGLYYALRGVTREGVKCVIKHEGNVMLVRHDYEHKRWTFPGGGAENGENFKEAAHREMREELSFDIQNVKKFGEYKVTKYFTKWIAHCVTATVSSPEFRIDAVEIAEASWFPHDDLPEDRHKKVDMILNLLKTSKTA